jgi:hypothetical protein
MPIYATLTSYTHTTPDPAAVTDTLQVVVLPWLVGTARRVALAAWVTGDPERICIPAQRPTARPAVHPVGPPAAARAVLNHLDRAWPSLARDTDPLAARHALDQG